MPDESQAPSHGEQADAPAVPCPNCISANHAATAGPPKVIIVVGMWLIFLPGLIVLPVKMASGPTPLSQLVPGIVYFVLSAAILYHTTVNFVRKRRQLLERPPEDDR